GKGVAGSGVERGRGPGDGTYNGINKMLGTLTLINGSSWLDSGFLEGQLFQLSGAGAVSAGLDGKTYKIDLITGTDLSGTGSLHKLDVLVISDPAHTGTTVPNSANAKLTSSGPATGTVMTVTQWAAVATYTPSDWYSVKTITVNADPGFDIQPGHENFRSFPKIEHRLDGIRGPLLVEGGATSAKRTRNEGIRRRGEADGPNFNVPPQPPESMSIDTLNIYDDGSKENLPGTLTSTALSGLNMGGGLDFSALLNGKHPFNEPGVYPGGISFGSISLVDDPAKPGTQVFSIDAGRSTIEVLNIMLGPGNDRPDIQGTLVPGPDHDPLTGAETTVSTHGGITAVHGGGNQPLKVESKTAAFTFTNTDPNGNAELARTDLLSWDKSGFAIGERVLLRTPMGAATFTVTGFADQYDPVIPTKLIGLHSRLLPAGGSSSLPTQTAAFKGSISVADNLSVSGTFTVQSDRIIRNDNLPWQSLGFAIGQQVAFTTGGVTKLYTITGFDNRGVTASGVSGPGSALLLTGNTLTAGSNITG